MKTILTPLVALAALTIGACGKSEDHTIIQGPKDPMAEELANAAPVELPPAISASKTYRCKDNSLVYIDWMSDGTARVKAERNAVGTPPVEGELTGTAADASVTYKGKACKA